MMEVERRGGGRKENAGQGGWSGGWGGGGMGWGRGGARL